jgi:NTE family protein
MPKTALVLSSGGMFGAYQAGAFRAIEAIAPPDIVVGASVGALNGWAIAAGCSADELIARWQDRSAGETLKLFPKRGLRTRWFDTRWFDTRWFDTRWFDTRWFDTRWFDPDSLRRQTEVLCRDFQPQLPLGVVLAELPLYRPRLMQFPDLGPLHLQATCSVPLFLPSVEINGKRYADGGLFEKLHIWAALQMGATRIIAIDSMPSLKNWLLRAGSHAARILKPPKQYARGLDLTIISPSESMGDANDGVFWKRENIDRWVAMGARDAAATLAQAATSRRTAS